MKTQKNHLLAITFVTALVATACASGTPEPQTGPRPDDAEAARLEALYDARVDSTRMNVSDADADFMTGMISHHAQALVMSHMAPTHGASPELLILTARISNAQTDEIRITSIP